ncbi:MAG: efflux RND transporter permease subunit [Thermodesulfobacteriota bacterium]
MKGAIAWFADNHVAANLLMGFFILAGIVTGLTMKLEVFPESSLDRITITTSYPGAAPEEVEEAVVRRIEEKVAGLAGIKRIDSLAREGFGQVTIEVMSGWDLKKLLDEVKAEVDRITTFPEEAEKPVVQELTARNQVINVAVYGEVPEATLKHLTERLKDDITNLPGISLAEIFGLRQGELGIEVSEETLRRYGLTLGQVAQAVRAASLDLPAGSVETEGGEILIRTKGRRYWAAEYLDVPVLTRPDGTKVTLGQIARVKDDFEDVDLFFRFQGKPAAAVWVYRVADQNAITVADQVKAYVEEVRPTLPAGVGIDYYQDMSELLKSRISLLLRNMAQGLVLVSLILGLVMNLRLAFWITLGIPVSFLAALIFLPGLDVSINMVSLFAFITVLGIVVDDATVIGENVHRKQEEGLPPLQAAIQGALEVGQPVIFSVLTTIVAFLPLLLAGGMMGKIMRNLPVVVTLVLLGSLTEALLILPSHLAGGRQALWRPKKEGRVSAWLKAFISGPYAMAVDYCVRWRYAAVAAGLALLLLAAGLYTSGLLQFTFFPAVEGDMISCAVVLPTGTPMERTVEVVERLESSAREALAEVDRSRPKGAPPLFEQSASLVGLQVSASHTGASAEFGGHLAQVWIVLLEGEERNYSAAALAQAWRQKMGPVPDAETITFSSDLFSAGNPVEIHLSLDDHQRLVAAADELQDELRAFPGVFDVADSFVPGKEELRFALKPAAQTLGLTLSDLAAQVRHAFYGAEALRMLRGKDEVKVMVRYPENERRSLGRLEDMRIRTPDGRSVPFSLVAEVKRERGYATIERAQRLRVIKVTAGVDESVTNANEVRQALMKDFMPGLKDRYPGLRYSLEGEGKEQMEALSDVFKGLIVALFCIYALLAVPFRSFTQPLIVMSAIPFGLGGALAGHLLMGYDISLISLFGMVGLAGVVVNDSLVLVHAANRLREQGLTPHEAVTKAGVLRFRAVLLTSLTTFGGLTPMLLERSLQARFLIPMAISLGFGVMFSTLVTLFMVPSGYIILEDVLGLLRRLPGLAGLDAAGPGSPTPNLSPPGGPVV